MKRFIFLFVLIWPLAAVAEDTLEEQARAALARLDHASVQLAEADGARDRVLALTEAISAHEESLAALREGMRKVAAREAVLSDQLQDQDREVAALLAVLQRLGNGPSPVSMAHSGGPTGSIRAAMLLSDIVPPLNAAAEELRTDLLELERLRDLQESTISQLLAGLSRLQSAREDLNLAIADRVALPKRFVNDPVREAILIASSETMAQFADGLDRIAVEQTAEAPTVLAIQKGSLPLPVAGQVLYGSGETDAAGVARPGIVVSVLSKAIVISPVTASVRYTGPLLDYGQVVILEPMKDLLFVLAGLETVYVAAGDVIDAGTPLGLTGGTMGKNAAMQSTDSELTGAELTETLYIEVRQENAPEDPDLWFRTDKDG